MGIPAMARRRTKLELSLFPFLNILFGLIAVLILHIFFIIQMSGVEGSAIGRARLGGGQDGDEELEQRLSERLRNLKEQIHKVDRQRNQAEADLEQRRLLVELRRLQEKDLIPGAGKGTAGVPIGAPAPAKWRMVPITSGGMDNLKEPILVEVTAESYIVHDFSANPLPKTKLPAIPAPPRTKTGDREQPLQAKPQLVEFLTNIDRNKSRRYLLFLIHPEGIDSFKRIKQYCNDHYSTPFSEKLPRKPSPFQLFDIGYEPFSDHWLLVGKAAKP
jgi:hypothetical protein